MRNDRSEGIRHQLPARQPCEATVQVVIELPGREVLTTLFSTAAFPGFGQTVPVDQSASGVTGTVGETTTTTTNLANNTAQSVPTQSGTFTQNVNSPGAVEYATQTQYAPVTKT